MDRKTSVDPELIRVFQQRRNDLGATARAAGPAEADDAVQDAFLHTIEAAEQREVRDPVRYLFRTLRREAFHRRRRSTNRARVEIADADMERPDEAPNAERSLIAAERLRRVLDIVERMPPRRREVFLAHRVEELSYAQIAARLGVSIRAVEKHIHLAMLTLKRGGE